MDENHPLIENVEQVLPTTSNYYDITEITEMGKMSSMFFNKTGSTLFYACIAIYLYGDLAIYGAAVSKSIRDVACSYKPGNTSSPLNISENEKCWEWKETSRLDVYRIILAVFTCTIGQFVFCNVSKTKYLQIATSIMRSVGNITYFGKHFNLNFLAEKLITNFYYTIHILRINAT